MNTAPDLNFLATLLPLTLVVFIIAVGVVMLNAQFHKNLYRQRLAQEELKSVHQQALLQVSITTQETERKRIAQDLHDELGASLSIARMHLKQLEDAFPHQQHALQGQLQNVRSMVENALAATRRISHELMPPQLETLGFFDTLETVAEQINQIHNITLTITLPMEVPPSLSWDNSIGLYRIIMELISNTLKHANATAITVTLTWTNHHINCAYQDNGIGLSSDFTGGGAGHQNIAARVNALQGNYTIGREVTSPGFYAHFKIPI